MDESQQEGLSAVPADSFCYPEYSMPENNGDLSTTCVDFLPVTAKTNLSEDQQLWLGWQALRWAMQKKGLGLPEDELSVLRQHPEDQREIRLQAILDSTKPFRSALLPVFASDHWTCWSATRSLLSRPQASPGGSMILSQCP